MLHPGLMIQRCILVVLLVLLAGRLYAQDALKQSQPVVATTHDPIYNDDNYTWGIFYFCREDPRMFPPKRSGMGWTINFASSAAVFIVVLSMVLLIFGNRYYRRYVPGKAKKN